LLPLTKENEKGQYDLVQPFLIFFAERCTHPPPSDKKLVALGKVVLIVYNGIREIRELRE
jgi:hypothetical protein